MEAITTPQKKALLIESTAQFANFYYVNRHGVTYETHDNFVYRDNVKVLALEHRHGILRYDLDHDFIVDYIAKALRTLLGYAIYKVTLLD